MEVYLYTRPILDGGNSNILYFYPERWNQFDDCAYVCRWVGEKKHQPEDIGKGKWVNDEKSRIFGTKETSSALRVFEWCQVRSQHRGQRHQEVPWVGWLVDDSVIFPGGGKNNTTTYGFLSHKLHVSSIYGTHLPTWMVDFHHPRCR